MQSRAPKAGSKISAKRDSVRGVARVNLDPDFAALVKTNRYHVFITPCDDSNGLFVARRSKGGF